MILAEEFLMQKNEKYSASKILFLHQKFFSQNHYGKRIFDAEK
jgi:hypothetical protein